MARPRSPETDDVIDRLARRNSIRQTAELLDMEVAKVQQIRDRHFEEVEEKMREYDRREKAEELAAMMRKDREAANVEGKSVPGPAAGAPAGANAGLAPAKPQRAKPGRKRVEPEKGQETRAPARKRQDSLRVSAYTGACGRMYTLNGRTIEVAGLASTFSKEDLRILANEALELVRLMDKREGVGA